MFFSSCRISFLLIFFFILYPFVFARTFTPASKPSRLFYPKPESVLKSDLALFRWTNKGAKSYSIWIGSDAGRSDYFSAQNFRRPRLRISGLPLDGRKLYVRIISRFSSSSVFSDFVLYSVGKIAAKATGEMTSVISPMSGGHLSAVWANEGGDKVTRDELRASKNSGAVLNSVWDGSKISLFGAKNEVINFNVILESFDGAKNVSVEFDTLTGPGGAKISSIPVSGNGLFDWKNRDIELFYIQYLQIQGLSRMSYELYDERHIPKRFRRPYDASGIGSGSWQDRPDHDKYYPDIAVPIQLKPNFDISTNSSQGIWTDIYIPKNTPAGLYSGIFRIQENGGMVKEIPVQLSVRNFSLPDLPNSKTMVFFSHENVYNRYLGLSWPNQDTPEGALARVIRDRHFQLAHRHKISLIDADETFEDAPSSEWKSRLDGSLFTPANGYLGPGEATGNNIYAIAPYGSWSWKSEGEAGMRLHTDRFVKWFDENSPQTDYFLYLIDESSDYPLIQQWANWIEKNPGAGKKLLSFATVPLTASPNLPALDIIASWMTVGDSHVWENSFQNWKSAGKKFYLYNGKRPSNGSFSIEDDGVALRELSWGQYKKAIDRWFFWESTYYNDYQGGRGETNVFRTAQTFGGDSGFDAVSGKAGWNYSNGDGVLFYPGTDKKFPTDSYNVSGPLASLRLKYWRRGIQDVDYLVLAAKKDPARASSIVQEIVPKVLWEYGIADPSDPTWVLSDISWSIDPDIWEATRSELAGIIEG